MNAQTPTVPQPSSTGDGPQPPERAETDASLQTERRRSDDAISQTHALHRRTDGLFDQARQASDDALGLARDVADGLGDSGAAALRQVAETRAAQDAVVHAERDAADEALRRERAAQARTMAALLPIERERTDRSLLTERRQADDALAHRDDFMGMVSHDLRNLLSGIVLNVTDLSETAPTTEEGQRTVEGLQRIQRYAARMNRLIGDLVDVISIDAGKLALVPSPNETRALIAEAVDAFAQSAATKGVALTFEEGPPLVAHFDRERLLQVLANLVGNAIKFTPRGGAIVLVAEQTGTDVRVTVTDTGIGVPAEMREAVFERFWQVGSNDKRGLGLGLSIAKSIVDAHGGRIWAEAAPSGTGSVFRFAIPVATLGG